MEAVDILAVVDGLDDPLLRNVAWQRELYDESVDVGVGVELFDGLQELRFLYGVLEADECGLESAPLAGLDLVGNVGFGASVVAHEYGCQVGAFAALGHHLFNSGRYLGLDLFGSSLSVDKSHRMSVGV